MASIGGRYNPPPDHSSGGVVEEEGHCCRYGRKVVCVVAGQNIPEHDRREGVGGRRAAAQ